MHKVLLVINVFLVLRVRCQEISNLKFPASFKFGSATSAYQIEGGWNASGKGVSYWDYFTHNLPYIRDGSTGDVACDSYNKYRDDIQILKDLKVNHYRFSISWTRILPTGFINRINQDGVDYYNNLINGLLEAGIEPWITMYHWDIPMSINHLGGWSHPKIADYLTDLADLLFSLYGDRVKTWITLNEPYTFCMEIIHRLSNYDHTLPVGIDEYLCSYNVLITHANIYRLYQSKYKLKQRGRVSLALVLHYYLPASNSAADTAAAERMRLFDTGIFIHPLVHGNFPPVVIDIVRNYSAIQGFPESRLPRFTLQEIIKIKGAYDFLGINHYTTRIARANNTIVDSNPTLGNDAGAEVFQHPSWETAASEWLKVYPEGFRGALNWIKDSYKNPEIVILEQGFSDLGELNDTRRINYMQSYLSEGLKAIHLDKVRLTAYTQWSLLDNFEWSWGYTVKFGVHHVDFESENRTRTPKQSAFFYRKVIETKCLVDQCIG